MVDFVSSSAAFISSAPADSISGKDPMTPPSLSENFNSNIDNDLRVINQISGKFWSDETELVEDSEKAISDSPNVDIQNAKNRNSADQDNSFTVVLTKSQKKKLRQQKKLTVRTDYYNTRNRAGS